MYVLIEKGILGDSPIYPSTKNPYDFSSAIFITPFSGIMMGILVGVLEVFVVGQSFKKTGFLSKVFLKTAAFVLIIVLMLIMAAILTNTLRIGSHPFSTEVLQTVWSFIANFVFFSIVIYAGTMIGFSVFLIEVSDKLGLSVFQNFVTGKYYKPREEERIFMFLDMKSSTTIAEELGHQTYYELLNQYYTDINEVILETEGEIYQYVGDEVVVSWSMESGLSHHNCVRCYFMVKERFLQKESWYKERFGVLPDFKAGIHFGIVITGEVGIVKKELLFTGDVLNTTARIRESCSQFGSDIIISRHLMERIKPLPPKYKATEIGETQLRGKKVTIRLFTLDINNQ